MCKYYDTLFSCFCENNLKIIRPCTCSLERPQRKLCDIYQPAKEPIVMRDLCAICALLGKANNARPEVVYERYYELKELEHLEETYLRDGETFANERAVVLRPDVFESVMELRKALPAVDVEEVASGPGDDEASDSDEGHEKEHLSPIEGNPTHTATAESSKVMPAFSMTLRPRHPKP